MRKKKLKKNKRAHIVITGAFLLIVCGRLYADGYKSGGNSTFKTGLFDNSAFQIKATPFPKVGDLSQSKLDTSADSYKYVGANLIAEGHVVIRSGSFQITCDKAVINLETKDLEVAGNVVFSGTVSTPMTLTQEEYDDLLKDPTCRVVVNGVTTLPTGLQKIRATVYTTAAYMKAARASGNLDTGALEFRDFMIKTGLLYCSGKFAERYPNGKIKLHDAKMTTCEYELDNNAHYSLGATTLTLSPREANRGVTNYNPDHGEHSAWAFNNIVRVWDFPVFWFPVLYKPADSNSFGARFEFGSSSDWGYYLRTSKEFELLDEPALVKAAAILDFYEERGFGYGATADIQTPESLTEIFAYSIHDRSPYEFWESEHGDAPDDMSMSEWVKKNSRFRIPHDRFEFKISNLTHLTPRLDFRGQFDLISDYNFLEDYFEARYDSNIQPPTFAALEYQGERFSATLQTVVKVNSFDTMVERLPEFRLDFQRQELFKNIYYQGQSSVGYYRMNWRRFDYDRAENPNLNLNGILNMARPELSAGEIAQANQIIRNPDLSNQEKAAQLSRLNPGAFSGYFDDPRDYSAFRFDTLHMFYYPIKLFDVINLIPRAGGRFTAYSRSSKRSVDVEDFYTMVDADDLDAWPSQYLNVQNYDKKGGARYRFVTEFGLEANTKFYRAWQTPKNAFWEIDGLRHVAVPYINYTFIPDPTVSYKKLYYFDDVDQIERQNFIRFGLQNRLQTRRNSQVQEWMALENYWDFHFDRTSGFNHVGDLGTMFRFTPFANLTFTTDLLLDVGGNNDHDEQVIRGNKRVGQPGISNKLINRWNTSLSYKITDDWIVKASYLYSDGYEQRTAYSMGSTLAAINATSRFRSYFERHQYLNLSLDFPSMIDERLKGSIYVSYDVEKALVQNAGFILTRDFHCWYFQLMGGASCDRDGNGDRTWSRYLSFAVGLTAMPGLGFHAKTGNRL